MPVTRAQVARSEADIESEDNRMNMSTASLQTGSDSENSLFKKELMATIVEQRDLLVEFKETQENRMFGIAEKLSAELQRLSVEFGRLSDKNKHLEDTVVDLKHEIQRLNEETAANQECLIKIHAGMLASSQEIVKQEIREEFRASLEGLRKRNYKGVCPKRATDDDSISYGG